MRTVLLDHWQSLAALELRLEKFLANFTCLLRRLVRLIFVLNLLALVLRFHFCFQVSIRIRSCFSLLLLISLIVDCLFKFLSRSKLLLASFRIFGAHSDLLNELLLRWGLRTSKLLLWWRWQDHCTYLWFWTDWRPERLVIFKDKWSTVFESLLGLNSFHALLHFKLG